MNFTDFNFKEELVQAIENVGFKEPSPVQEKSIPLVLQDKDLIVQAHTGTGKTAAFGLPILNKIDPTKSTEALIIVPTRELAIQVSDEIYRFGQSFGIKTATVYGGTSYSRQLKHIANSSVIIATPGRLLDILSSKKIEISPSVVVLDEADEMLDMGFLEDIKSIFSHLEYEHQTLMFSATMPKEIEELGKSILTDPEVVSITKKNEVVNENIKQYYYIVDEYERDEALVRLFDYKSPQKSIIFCRTKKEVSRLATFLVSQGFLAKPLHGDMEQREREEVIRSYKHGSLEVLIATDIASRGLDVSNITHVFNYHLPFNSEDYVHRIGRTGRAGKKGLAITIVTPQEFRALQRIQKVVGKNLETKVIPTIDDVKTQKQESVLNAIKEQEISEQAVTLIDSLKDEIELSTLVHKLASLVVKDNINISGKDQIGKSESEIKYLFQKLSSHSGGGNNRRRNNYGNRRYGDRDNRGGGNYRRRDYGDRDNRGGYRGDRDRNDRDNRGGGKSYNKYKKNKSY
jgi:ATP-dependent RNA helicase DeaD